MTDRPIIFSAPMVRAMLEGRKTQTRRNLSIKGHRGFFQFMQSDTKGYDWTFRRADHVWEDYSHSMLLSKLPYAIGDRLYVRESVVRQETDQGVGFQTYAADGSQAWPLTQWYHKRNAIPSIHMPRWASRLTLTVTDVRVQRLQDISEADAKAEGVGVPRTHDLDGGPIEGVESVFDGTFCADHRDAMQHAWQTLHGPGEWAANRWVVAVSFTVQRGNIDQIGGAA